MSDCRALSLKPPRPLLMMTIQLQFSRMNWSMKTIWTVTVIDADSRRMTVRWVLFPFRKEVWCCERLAAWACCWCRDPSGAVVSQVPCRNAFATTQTCSGESMTDPPALQSAARVYVSARMCVKPQERLKSSSLMSNTLTQWAHGKHSA